MQAKLKAGCAEQKTKHMKSGSLLQGRIFDGDGNRMTPVHTRKGAIRYRYYVSVLTDAGGHSAALRIPAPRIEENVIAAVRKHLPVRTSDNGDEAPSSQPQSTAEIIERTVERIVATRCDVTITQKPAAVQSRNISDRTVKIPFCIRGRAAYRQIIPGNSPPHDRHKTLRAERRLTLLTTIANAKRWAEELTSGRVADIATLANNESLSERNIRRALPLAFLAPDIVQAAIDGELPRDLVMTRIQSDLPISWSEQHAALGLA